MIVGDVSPASSTLTTSAGEDVTLTMTQHYGSTNELRWRHNGDDVTAWNGQSSISILNVQLHHTGIYECFIEGRHHLQNHALMKLLVRRKLSLFYSYSSEKVTFYSVIGNRCIKLFFKVLLTDSSRLVWLILN